MEPSRALGKLGPSPSFPSKRRTRPSSLSVRISVGQGATSCPAAAPVGPDAFLLLDVQRIRAGIHATAVCDSLDDLWSWGKGGSPRLVSFVVEAAFSM
jgi:hypothetical protein